METAGTARRVLLLLMTRQRQNKGGYEWGKDYNHSTYADIVINKIFGIEPLENRAVQSRPMLPEAVVILH